jgi:co-chaperonin GroES (HSP10)
MKPIGKNILVELIEKKKEGLIEIPGTVLDSVREAKVIKLGTGVEKFQFEVEENNIIFLKMSMTTPVTWDGSINNRYIVHHDEILAKYDNVV